LNLPSPERGYEMAVVEETHEEGAMDNAKTQEAGRQQILFPVAVGAVFLFTLVVGAFVG